MIHPDWKEVLFNRSIAFAATAASPRLAHMLRWPTRLCPRGVVPYVKRMVEERKRAEHELREQLGRDPTTDEVLAHLGIEFAARG